MNGDYCGLCGRREPDYHHYSCFYFSEELRNAVRYFLEEPDVSTWEGEGGR